MVDHLTKKERSWNMSRIRSDDTKPELAVRSIMHRMGYRFRLHGKVSRRDHPAGILPGKPDIVLKKYRTVISVHGCFWHRHSGCKYTTTPKTRTEWWLAKFARNIERDKQVKRELRGLGWNIAVVWECELRDPECLAARLDRELRREPMRYPEIKSDEELMVAED